MKKIKAVVLAAVFLLILTVSVIIVKNKQGGARLTLDTVCGMAAEKGEALTWSDFEQYPSVDIGSGLYILSYEIDGNYQLWIGGIPDSKPMYIRLVSVKDHNQYIDIRYGNIKEFLDRTK